MFYDKILLINSSRNNLVEVVVRSPQQPGRSSPQQPGRSCCEESTTTWSKLLWGVHNNLVEVVVRSPQQPGQSCCEESTTTWSKVLWRVHNNLVEVVVKSPQQPGRSCCEESTTTGRSCCEESTTTGRSCCDCEESTTKYTYSSSYFYEKTNEQILHKKHYLIKHLTIPLSVDLPSWERNERNLIFLN